MEIYRAIEKCNYRKIFPKNQEKIDKVPRGGECARRLQNKLVTRDQEEGRNAAVFILLCDHYFILLVFFEDPLFGDSPDREPGGHQNRNRGFT